MLRLLSPSSLPYSYDLLDAEVGTFKGGEVVALRSTSLATGDLAAHDAFDGYLQPPPGRPVVTKVLVDTDRILMLSDDGVSGYGNIFGTVVGATAGQVVSGGLSIGLSSELASGKMTVWHQAGLFGVSLNAVDTDAAVGIRPDRTSGGLAAGTPLYAKLTTGVLTANPVGAVGASSGGAIVVARFVSFDTDGSFSNNPAYTVGATDRKFTYAVIRWLGA